MNESQTKDLWPCAGCPFQRRGPLKLRTALTLPQGRLGCVKKNLLGVRASIHRFGAPVDDCPTPPRTVS
jgi:hypothetical protein